MLITRIVCKTILGSLPFIKVSLKLNQFYLFKCAAQASCNGLTCEIFIPSPIGPRVRSSGLEKPPWSTRHPFLFLLFFFVFFFSRPSSVCVHLSRCIMYILYGSVQKSRRERERERDAGEERETPTEREERDCLYPVCLYLKKSLGPIESLAKRFTISGRQQEILPYFYRVSPQSY